MERIPRPGEFYRHFKNKLYQITAIAIHSETGERMVVYQALYGDFAVYVRPLSMFMEPVDREKYPDAAQNDRFERVVPDRDGSWRTAPEERMREEAVAGIGRGAATEDRSATEDKSAAESGNTDKAISASEAGAEEESAGLSPLLMEFLDAETCERRLAVLQLMKGKVGQRELDSLYMSLDLKPFGGTAEEQLDNLKRYLNMQQRFDTSRLRRS